MQSVTIEKPLLQAKELSMRFGGLIAVDMVSFDVPVGKTVSIVGPNGAGKTTLFNLISGVTKPTSGHVSFDGQNVTGMRADEICRRGIGRTFQNIRLFNHLNVIENVMVGRTCRTKSGLIDALLWRRRDRCDRKESVERAVELLEWVGGADNILRMPRELSYGDQRRVEIARALATEPKLLVLDEPTAGMIAKEAHSVIELMGRLTERGITLLLIEHNMNVVMSVSDKIVVLNFGKLIAEGTPDEIRINPSVIQAYLGAEE